ncbi:MAG TPA: hypothetical protein VEO54_26250 [Thermoanaerobaculia bacterium]|nr:hypothetical protein [Thermoanaerobaculia bacterium]
MKSTSRVVAAALAFWSFTAAAAPRAESLSSDPPGRHFIVLLDDSGDSPLIPRDDSDPAAPIAERLFAPLGNGPGFDPRRDALSVVFFQVIENRPYGCFDDRPLLSITPEGMFDEVAPSTDDRQSALSMAAYLRAEFAKTMTEGGCRFARHGYSPIERSKRLVLPYLAQRGATSSPVSEIVLLQVSNKRSNPLGDVTGDVRGIFADKAASDELHRRVDDSVSIRFVDSYEPVHHLYIERYRVTPNVTGGGSWDELLTVPGTIELRRRAVRHDRIRLETVNGAIRLRSTQDFVPIRLVLASETAQPLATIDVEHCAAPCELRGGERVVDVIRAVPPAVITRSTFERPSRVFATARCRYVMPGIYDGFVVDSRPHEMRIHREKPLVVPAVPPLWKPLAIDNGVLARAWRTSDVRGLDQATAFRRISSQRSTIRTVLVLSAALAVLFLVYLLVTHRGFHPIVDLRTSAGVIDFNAAIPPEIEASQLEVFNSAAATFERFQRNPNGVWHLSLNPDVTATWPEYGDVSASGLDVSSFVALRARAGADESLHTRLSGRGDTFVSLIVSGRQLASILPPPGWTGGPATLRVTGTVSLDYDTKSDLYPFSHDLQLVPERTATPKLLLNIPTAVQWRAGEALDLGSTVLVSASRYRFATPAETRRGFELAGDAVSYRCNDTVTIAGKEKMRIRLLAPEGTTPNPTHVEEQWTVRLDLDGAQPVEKVVTVHKDVSTPEAHVTVTCGTAAEPLEIAWRDGRLHARQRRSAVATGDDDTVGVSAAAGAVHVARNDSALLLCTVGVRLGKPALGGNINAAIGAALHFSDGRSVAATVTPADDSAADDGATLVVAGAAMPSAAVAVTHADVFDALLMQRVIAQTAQLRLTIDVTIADGGRSIRQHATVLISQELVRHEHGTILAIDFGNSAVAVATLTQSGEMEVTNLQEIPLLDERTLAQEDPDNAEKGSPLIPSPFAIEFDRRNSNGGRPGTTWAAQPETLDGSDPRTISLPALSAHYSSCPERVVQSIKHIVGSDYDEMELYAPIRSERGTLHSFKVDKLLIGVMRALAETYVGTELYERLVFTVPNAFLPWQEQRVRTAIEAAFTSLQPEWTRSLSESDAVMHRYLASAPQNHRRELILFYDFGSGTIDLTLTELLVDEGGNRARILARIGFDRAGAYLDQVLTSIVHRNVENALDATPGAYRFPLLGESATPGAANFASELASAKKHWQPAEPLCISQHDEHASIVDPRHWRTLSRTGLAGETRRDGITVPCIALSWDTIHTDRRITHFFEFVKSDLVALCLHLGEKTRQDLTHVVVSGRGALWPGFIDALRASFPSGADVRKIFDDPDEMKLAVVRGAAASRQKRASMTIDSVAPEPTYLAFADLDFHEGTWRDLRVLGTTPVVLPAGELTLAVIPFAYDDDTLRAMLRHPFGRRLVRRLPFQLPVSRDREVKAFLARERGRTKIKLDDGFLTEVVAGGRKWPVGSWSVWNASQLGEDT